MSVNNPKNMSTEEALLYLRVQSDAVGKMVDLLNQYEKYLQAERDSPVEDQEEKALTDGIEGVAANPTFAAEVIMAFLDALNNVARGANMQEYLNHVSEFLHEQAEEIRRRAE